MQFRKCVLLDSSTFSPLRLHVHTHRLFTKRQIIIFICLSISNEYEILACLGGAAVSSDNTASSATDILRYLSSQVVVVVGREVQKTAIVGKLRTSSASLCLLSILCLVSTHVSVLGRPVESGRHNLINFEARTACTHGQTTQPSHPST